MPPTDKKVTFAIMKWYVCSMDYGCISQHNSKKEALIEASTYKLVSKPISSRQGKGCYELLDNQKQGTCIWIIRQDCLHIHGFAPTIDK